MIETRIGSFEPESRMLIGGRLVESSSGAVFDNINPATAEVIGEVADGTHADMDAAVAAARNAFDTTAWATDRALRKRCLEQLQHAIETEREQLRAELVAETGTPVSVTYGPQLDMPLEDAFRWPAQRIEDYPWERSLPDNSVFGIASRRLVTKEPHGVVGAIVPWNFPFEVTANKLGPILATGNTVVLKPAPDTPWNGTRLGRIISESTDIPAGVVNIVTSSDNLVAEDLILDPRVDTISFTGSTATGRRIMEKGAATLKRVFLELGGKSAMIICEDADLEKVLPAAGMVCYHAGQGCALQTRLLLPRSRYAEGIEILKAVMEGIPFGDPEDPTTIHGPQVSAKQRDRVMSYIRLGVDEGARLLVGGGKPAELGKGFFVEPTLFVDVENSMRIAREEIFGPVLAVLPYDDDADAVRIANDSEYGLSGSVFAGDPDRAMGIARQIRTGTINVNGGVFYGADAPFGGYKNSGVGRQNGNEGFETYLETKTVAIAI